MSVHSDSTNSGVGNVSHTSTPSRLGSPFQDGNLITAAHVNGRGERKPEYSSTVREIKEESPPGISSPDSGYSMVIKGLDVYFLG